jgi:hypothetical protein
MDTYHKISLQGKLNLYDFYNAIMQKSDNYGGSKTKVGGPLLVTTRNHLFIFKSIGITRCRGARDNGVTSKTSKEVQGATQLPQSTSSVTGLWLLNAPPAPIQDEIYLPGGMPNPAHSSKLLQLLYE